MTENNIDYQNFIDFISRRRSVRNYKNKPVEKELIEKIITSLEYAPYGAKPNEVEITVVNNRSKIKKVLPLFDPQNVVAPQLKVIPWY